MTSDRDRQKRIQDRMEKRRTQREIAANMKLEASSVDLNAEVVAIRHAVEQAELAFADMGDNRTSPNQMQERALNEIKLAKHRYEVAAIVHREVQSVAQRALEAERVARDERRQVRNLKISERQMFLAIAITVATLVQALYAYKTFAKPDAAPVICASSDSRVQPNTPDAKQLPSRSK